MKTYVVKLAEIEREWFLVDAKDKSMGRLAAKIARILMGKHKPTFTPSVDTGDYVVVINADKLNITGKKLQAERFYKHSTYPGGFRSITSLEMLAKKPEKLLTAAVHGMLPKTKLGMHMMSKLKVHCELPKHAYSAQQLKPLDL